jgi:hypothetical protein
MNNIIICHEMFNNSVHIFFYSFSLICVRRHRKRNSYVMEFWPNFYLIVWPSHSVIVTNRKKYVVKYPVFISNYI